MKMTLEQHRQCLKNTIEYNKKQRQLAEDSLRRCEYGEKECAFYAQQIAAAEKQHKDCFDPDRFMKREKS